jgi:hypothetical protein
MVSSIAHQRITVIIIALVLGGVGLLAPTPIGATTSVACDPTALVSAINSANSNGGDTLDLTAGCTYAFATPADYFFGPNALPTIRTAITIHGHGATLTRSGSTPMRFFAIAGGIAGIGTGSLSLDTLTISNGLARGASRTGAAVAAGSAARSTTWGR